MRRGPRTIPVALALASVALHLAFGGRYPLFRDELYYWDCANHLAWGYVDHPPLSIAVLALWKSVFVTPLVATVAVANFMVTVPFAVPLLPVETFIAYQRAIGIRPASGENRDTGELPQFFADRFGWKELAAQVVAVVDALPPEERAACLVVGNNYGQTAALNYFGPPLGLPRAVCQHNSYYLWGPGTVDPRVYVIVGQDQEGLDRTFTYVREVARTGARYAMPDETNVPIWVCRGIRIPLDEAWRRGRMYI